MGGLCARSIFCVDVFWIFVFALLLCASLGKLCAEVETVCPLQRENSMFVEVVG